jgi:preprotein translocase subunit SecY
MTDRTPPAAAQWLLRMLGPANPALAGDLLEEYGQGRSARWYWKQVLIAIAVAKSKAAALLALLIAAFRVAIGIPVPGVNAEALASLSRTIGRTELLAGYNLISGGNIASASVFALGLAPFISAAIIVETPLLFGWWTATNRRSSPWALPIVRAIWVVGVLLAALQASGLALFLERQSAGGLQLVYLPGWTFRVSVVVTLTAASASLMWVADRVTENHIGNGMFLVALAAVSSGFPGFVGTVGIAGATARTALHLAIIAVVSHVYRRAFDRRLNRARPVPSR